jgi:hypothetical protein
MPQYMLLSDLCLFRPKVKSIPNHQAQNGRPMLEDKSRWEDLS